MGARVEYRGGTFHYRNLMEGTAGTIDNFQLSMERNEGRISSRPGTGMNFEQFRFQLEGDLNFTRDGTSTPGMCGYFPEGGTSYGPQTSAATAINLRKLLFGGSSGQGGYLSRQEVKQEHGRAARHPRHLRRAASIGATKAFSEPGKGNMDGYQAIWEHANGRPLHSPKPRYDQPVMMDQASYY